MAKPGNADFLGFFGRAVVGALREGRGIHESIGSAIVDVASGASAAAEEGEDLISQEGTPQIAPKAGDVEAEGEEVKP